MRRVIKIGGSLLSRADLPGLFTGWINRQGKAENLVIVGGGELVDAIRTLDQIRPGDSLETHWRCVDLLDVTYQVVSSWFAWQLVSTSSQLEERLNHGFAVDRANLVAVRSFYDRDSTIDVPLDWQTTSDTIAAILANKVGADELVLLKSCYVDPR